MAKKSETGHAKNVANFGELITGVESLGEAYNPGKEAFKVTALRAVFTSSEASMLTVKQAETAFAEAVDKREAAFSALGKLVTGALNLFKSMATNPAEVETAASLARKIRGSGKSASAAAKAAADPEKKKISTAQTSFVMRTDNFEAFIQELAGRSFYKPNEESLKPAGLTQFLYELKAVNKGVEVAQAALHVARTRRNDLLYAKSNGLVDVAMGVKSYVKGAFAANPERYAPIIKLEFKPR